MAGPFDNIIKMKERLLSKTPAPPKDDEDDTPPIRRQSPGVQREGITPQEWAFAIFLLTMGGVAWNFIAPAIIRPDYSPIQKYFTAKGDPDGGEHAVSMFKARDAGIPLAIMTIYHDRPESRIATATAPEPKATKQ